MEDIKKAILEFAEGEQKDQVLFQRHGKGRSTEDLPDAKAREIKKAATALVNEEKLIYLFHRQQTMYGLKGRGQTEDH